VRIHSDDEIEGTRYGNGCPAFQPPEESKEDYLGYFKLDVWSSGVVLYMMTIGKHPFEEEQGKGNIMKLLENISTARYSFPDTIDDQDSLKDLIKSTLEIDIEKRFSLKQIGNICSWTSFFHF
jgi:serine/threonine protein kinase